MSKDDDSAGKGIPKDARIRFAELLRRTERNGERIRLTRRGAPIAYIVPLSDGEKLKFYEEYARRKDDRRALPESPEGPEFPELPPFSPEPEGEDNDDAPFIDHGDETERDMAISVFKKSVMHILSDTRELKRPEIQERFKEDNYIGTAVRKVIGTGK